MAYEIEAGPGALDLILALAEGDVKYRRPITFTLNVKLGKAPRSTQMHVQLYALERKEVGNTTHDWIFKGYEVDRDRHRVRLQKVEGYYSTRTNKGEVTLLKA